MANFHDIDDLWFLKCQVLYLIRMLQDWNNIGYLENICIWQIKLPRFPVLLLVAFHVWHV